jgi:hypothetical protein
LQKGRLRMRVRVPRRGGDVCTSNCNTCQSRCVPRCTGCGRDCDNGCEVPV